MAECYNFREPELKNKQKSSPSLLNIITQSHCNNNDMLWFGSNLKHICFLTSHALPLGRQKAFSRSYMVKYGQKSVFSRPRGIRTRMQGILIEITAGKISLASHEPASMNALYNAVFAVWTWMHWISAIVAFHITLQFRSRKNK